jgi:hypothetical protein
MQCQGADIVAANRCERVPFDVPGNCYGHGSFLMTDDRGLHVRSSILCICGVIITVRDFRVAALQMMPDTTPFTEQFDGCLRTEFVQQAFLGRIAGLLRSPWDPILKNNGNLPQPNAYYLVCIV